MTAREYKRNARMVLNGNYMPFVLSRLVFMIVTWLITAFSGNIISLGIGFGNNIAITSGMVILSLVTDFAMLFIGYMFTFGYTKMGLRLNRGQKIEIGMALDGFRPEQKPWKMVGLSFLNALISFIIMFIPVSMFIVGTYISVISNEFHGILNIASWLILLCSLIVAYINFGLALSVYIIIDHPEISIFTAMLGSFRMMRGRRFKLIWLSIFSFFGWHMLNLLTAGVLSIWLEPYIMSSVIQFYMDINGEHFVYTDMNSYQYYQSDDTYPVIPEEESKPEEETYVTEASADTAETMYSEIEEDKLQDGIENISNDAMEEVQQANDEETKPEEIKEEEINKDIPEETAEKRSEEETVKSKTFEELMEELYKENKLKEDNYFGKGDKN